MAKLVTLYLALGVVMVVSQVSTIEAGKRRVHISDKLDDVEDNEEDDDWKNWGKPKPKARPEFDPPPNYEEGMDLGIYQAEMMKRHIGPAMGFVKLRIDVPRELEETTKIAWKWTELLKSGSINAKIMVVDRNTIMFTIPDGENILEVRGEGVRAQSA